MKIEQIRNDAVRSVFHAVQQTDYLNKHKLIEESLVFCFYKSVWQHEDGNRIQLIIRNVFNPILPVEISVLGIQK